MSNKSFTIIITIALTSLFWLIVGPYIMKMKDSSAQKPDKEENVPMIDYSESILGRWDPVDIAKDTLVFNYGVMVQLERSRHSYYSFLEDTRNSEEQRYALSRDTLTISPDKYNPPQAIIKIYDEADNTYLEIHNLTDYAGKYVKHQAASAHKASKPMDAPFLETSAEIEGADTERYCPRQ